MEGKVFDPLFKTLDRKKIRVKDFAKAVGCDRSTLTRMRNADFVNDPTSSNFPSSYIICTICNHLQCSIHDVMQIKPNSDPNNAGSPPHELPCYNKKSGR